MNSRTRTKVENRLTLLHRRAGLVRFMLKYKNASDTKKRVGILRGGLKEHYSSSLRKGGEIISYISENLADKYKPYDILVDKDGKWHLNGVPIDPSKTIV